MIHIKETEIIPLLKEAQTEYSQKITEGDPKDVEMAERIEEALTQAMDIVYDYQSITDEHKRMVEKYETEAPETMTALPMDLVSENREHLPTHSRPQTGTE